MSSFKENYDELKEIFKDFHKKAYFESFSSSDIFYILDSKGGRCLSTFIDQFFGEATGLQLFYTRDGFNYVHDVLTGTEDSAITVGDCDSIVAVEKRRENLTEEDKKFLKKMNVRLSQSRNLIVYRLVKGHRQRIVTDKEMDTCFLYIEFLASVIANEKEDILEAFRNENCCVASLNIDRCEYSMLYRPLPLLEENPKRSPIYQPFVEEYQNHTYLNEECYLYTSYLPTSIKETRVRPLLLYFYFMRSNKMIVKYITDGPREYKNCIYGILDDVFTSYGMPEKLVLNNRDLYFITQKTLEALHIEVCFERNNQYLNGNLNEILSQVYTSTQDGEIDDKETINSLMEMITGVINSMELDEPEYEEEQGIEYVS